MNRRSDSVGGWRLVCPDCGQGLGTLDGMSVNGPAPDRGCTACGRRLSRRGNILDARPASMSGVIERFLNEYGAVRRAEGRGSDDPAWYRALPFVPTGDPLARQWEIRARSWKCFEHELMRRCPEGRGIDLGAGVGWLSARLAAAGWDMLAIDLSDDDRDGLGASRHFAAAVSRLGPRLGPELGSPLPVTTNVLGTDPDRSRRIAPLGPHLDRPGEQPPFDCLLAHFDHLPLAEGQADLVVFNASFHYSADFSTTLAEALRVLVTGGRIVILDSPTYRRQESGEMMVRERRADFQRRFGFASEAQNSREFLLKGELDSLGGQLGIRWRRIQPRYGMAWRTRPIRYRLAGKGREPAEFALWVGRRKGEGDGKGDGEGML